MSKNEVLVVKALFEPTVKRKKKNTRPESKFPGHLHMDMDILKLPEAPMAGKYLHRSTESAELTSQNFQADTQ